jgi:hypothetical protein
MAPSSITPVPNQSRWLEMRASSQSSMRRYLQRSVTSRPSAFSTVIT